MVEKAREALGPEAELFVSDLVDLDLHQEVDAVFSNAVFHWIPDHDRLFARLFEALRPGGQLVAQCGGAGNVAEFHEVLADVAAEAPFDGYIGGWAGPWNFATPAATTARLSAIGFGDSQCWLEDRPVQPDEPDEFTRTVCLGHHLDRLPEELRPLLVERMLDRLPKPLTLDYVRLNIDAWRPD
jgi:trans-aconitate 2-methyltransferase